MQSEMAHCAPVPPSGELDEVSSFDSGLFPPLYGKKHHSQDWKYVHVMYHTAITEGLSQGQR